MVVKERFVVLDIFRGIFSSFVVFFHMSGFSTAFVINNNFIYNSDLFVDFFFVLSGFVIAYSYKSISTKNELNKFFKKRFFRLYPLHLIILLIFLCIELSKHFASHYVHVNKVINSSNNLTTFLTNLFLINSIKIPTVNDVSWNITSWSISAEMIAYLVFGIITTCINRNNLNKFKNPAYLLIIVASYSTIYFLTNQFKLAYTFDYGFLRSLTGFFTGVICYSLYKNTEAMFKQVNKIVFNFLETFFIVIALIFVYYGSIFKEYGFIYEIIFSNTILIFSFEKGWLSLLLKKSNLLHQMGKYSYSIYMIHPLLLSFFNILFIRILKFPISSYSYLFILNYIFIYFVSAWTFKNIEIRYNQLASSEAKKTWWIW